LFRSPPCRAWQQPANQGSACLALTDSARSKWLKKLEPIRRVLTRDGRTPEQMREIDTLLAQE
jgi:hypothetical protein